MKSTKDSDSLFWKENLDGFAHPRGNGLWRRFERERRLLRWRRLDIVRSREKPECAVIASRIYKHVTTPTGRKL
jgi:hypothetical protein